MTPEQAADLLEVTAAGRGPDTRSGHAGKGARRRRMRRAVARIHHRREVAAVMCEAAAMLGLTQ